MFNNVLLSAENSVKKCNEKVSFGAKRFIPDSLLEKAKQYDCFAYKCKDTENPEITNVRLERSGNEIISSEGDSFYLSQYKDGYRGYGYFDPHIIQTRPVKKESDIAPGGIEIISAKDGDGNKLDKIALDSLWKRVLATLSSGPTPGSEEIEDKPKKKRWKFL